MHKLCKNKPIVWSARSEFMRLACFHLTASTKCARRAHLELVSLACVHPTASSKCARRAHLELVSLACVHHCHICCPNPSSEYAWNRILDKSRHTLKMSRDCPEILDTFWEVVKDHRFVVLMQKSSDFFQYNHDSMLFRVSRLFYNLDWEINGKKCTCLMMQSDFIFQKMSRNMAKMKMCELYRHEKVKKYG